MDLELDEQTRAFRDEVRAFLAEHVPAPPLPSMDTPDGFEAHRAWEHTLADARLSVVSWPEDCGGRDASLIQWVVFEEEYFRAQAPLRVSQNGIFLLAPTLFAHGTPEQLQRILPPMARADQIWAQAWSEPEAGSDLAGIKSRATRTDGGWLLSGQKTWSTRATYADRGFGLFRSDPEAERHRGLTYFMFDLRADGVTVRGIPQLDGEPGFAEIFLDDVFVPDADVLGGVGDGWKVAMSTASNERGLSLRSPGRFLAAASRLVESSDGVTDTALTDRVVDAWIGARAYELHTWATVTRLNDGGELGAESSIGKLFWSQLDVALHETALDLRGASGELAGDWMSGYLFSLAGPIYAGTNEIQRNVVAERLLGTPPMKFAPDAEQVEFATALRDMLASADVPTAIRAWAAGDAGSGRKLWTRLDDMGLTELAGEPVGLVLAFEELGRAAVPGPYVESVAVLPALGVELGDAMATLAVPPHVPYALDGAVADAVYLLDGTSLSSATVSGTAGSVDKARLLAEIGPSKSLGEVEPAAAFERGVLATAAQLLGLGAALLDRSVAYAKQRSQFGKPIGSFQAVKHQLADVAVALDLARPLLFGAALGIDGPTAARDVSAAKIACGDAAYLSARTALQVHGAIGYTAEYDLALWLTKVRALISAWGTQRFHRERVLAAIR